MNDTEIIEMNNHDHTKVSFFIIVESSFMSNYTDKFDLELTPELKRIFDELLNVMPEFFNDIETEITDIIKDDKIKIKDISKMIEIFKYVYFIIFSIKEKKITTEKCAYNTNMFLKYIINLIIYNNRIIVNEKSNLIKELYSFIESCNELIMYSKIIKPKKCLQKLFR